MHCDILIYSELDNLCMCVLQNPVVYVYIFMFSLTGYFGVNVVLNLVKIYGALIAVTGMALRYSTLFILSAYIKFNYSIILQINVVTYLEFLFVKLS